MTSVLMRKTKQKSNFRMFSDILMHTKYIFSYRNDIVNISSLVVDVLALNNVLNVFIFKSTQDMICLLCLTLDVARSILEPEAIYEH